MNKYIDPSVTGTGDLPPFLSAQLQSFQSAVETLNNLVKPLGLALQQLEQRVAELEKSSVSPQSLEKVRLDMKQFYFATQQKERTLGMAMLEAQNLGRQVRALEVTLSASPTASRRSTPP